MKFKGGEQGAQGINNQIENPNQNTYLQDIQNLYKYVYHLD